MHTSMIDIAAAASLEVRKSAEKIEYAVGGGGADDVSRVLSASIGTQSNDGEKACQGG
jgi:hypothetical protein